MIEIRKTYTKNEFKQAMEKAKEEGHIFRFYTWNYAIFKDLAIERCYEV